MKRIVQNDKENAAECTIIDLTQEEPKRKRQRSKGTATDGSPTPKARQKLRRSARLSGRAAGENRAPKASATTSAPVRNSSGFVFSAGGQQVTQPRHPPPQLSQPAEWGQPTVSRSAVPKFSAGSNAQPFSDQNCPPARTTHGYPSMCNFHDQAQSEASSFSNFSAASVPLQSSHVSTYQPMCGPPALQTAPPLGLPPPMPTAHETNRNPFAVRQNSFSGQQPFSFYSFQQPQNYGQLVGQTSEQSTQPSAHHAQRLGAHEPPSSSGNVEASSTFLNIPQHAVNLWNIAKNAADDECEDLCRYSGTERRAREDKLYKRLNEPVLRLTDAVRKLRMRIRGAQQSHRHVDHNLQRQLVVLEDKRRRMLDEAAARMFLAQNRSRRAFSMIDLHRLAVPAAIDFLTVALQKAAESLESSFPASGRHLLMVVTGWGRHTEGEWAGKGALKNAVEDQLGLACVRHRFNCDFATVNKGALLVALHPRNTVAERPYAKDIADSEVLLN